jgi:hypothetical protein
MELKDSSATWYWAMALPKSSIMSITVILPKFTVSLSVRSRKKTEIQTNNMIGEHNREQRKYIGSLVASDAYRIPVDWA